MSWQRRLRPIVLALAALALTSGAALGDAYFEICDMMDWDEALGTGHVVPLMPHEWDQYMDEWLLYTEEGETYPETLFIPAELYPYNGPEVPPDPDGCGGLVMAWGDESLPDGDYASAWKYDYLVDPDLTNAVITLVVYPPQFGPGGGITQISFGVQDINGNTRSWFWNVGPGQTIPWNVGTPVTIYPGQTGLNATIPPADGFMNNPAFNVVTSQFFIADENGVIIGGQVPIPPPGGPPAAVWNYWYNIVVSPGSGPSDYLFEFSLDIASDIELSDPFMDGDEAADPGDVYWWQSAAISPPGRDGFKDDMFIFGNDPWPDPPDATLATRVPVGFGSIEDYWEYFDLDGHDQTDFSLIEAYFPIWQFTSQCVYGPQYLMISFDDDMAHGWPANDVPVTRPSPAGVSSYGTSAGQDEIIGVTVMVQPVPPPYPLLNMYPIADEVTVHQSMAPNPDNGDREDDDVDSLDIVENQETCPYWYFTADHEAHLGLDPGGIYEVTMMGPVQVIDEFFHLGISEDTDIDAFEFTWLPMPEDPANAFLALLYSVDDDDPLTGANESGGMNPGMVYVSWMTGFSMPFTDPLEDDIDALTIWRDSLEEEEQGACCYGDDLDQCIVTDQFDCEQNLLGQWMGPGTDCSDWDGSGVADICEDVGACCYDDPVLCVITTEFDCVQNLLGDWKGVGTDCSDLDGSGVADICEDIGACCYEDPILCVITTEFDCVQNLLGDWKGVGTDCSDFNGNGVADICEEPTDYLFEFSLDIASDTELSDPFVNGNEAFDPGDVYWWQSAPVIPPGRDGFKDDAYIFGGDPWPDPPDAFVPPATRVPVGAGGTIEDYREYFDLDGHDQIDVDLHEVQWIPIEMPLDFPIPKFPSECIYAAEFLMVSFDDDMAPGWPAFDVPVTVPSMAGMVYGTTGGQDEIMGVSLALMAGAPPYPIVNLYPIADEVTVHQSLAPNPDGAEEEDDDVDSLDIVPGYDYCPYWYFTADHEAFLGLDPGGIYQVTPFGPVQVIDEFIHLGISEDTDIDAFEFAWLENPDEPGMAFLVLLYSVDEDDPLTPVDESGGMMPMMIYASYLTGWSFELSEPLQDDVDALTIWREELGPRICRGDLNCDGQIDFGDINPFVLRLTNPALYFATYPGCPNENGDINADGNVDFGDINPFVALLTSGPLPIPCP